MDISKNIKAIREERKISQSEIARRLGVEPTNYPRMEKRGDKLTIEQLGRIAGALGVSVVELLTGERQMVQDSERTKELEKRVEELEDRLKDKELIYSQINKELITVKNDLYNWFYYDYFIQAACKYGIGKMELFDRVSGKVLASFLIGDEDAFNTPIWRKAQGEGFSKIDYGYDFTDDEKKHIAALLFEDKEYRDHMIGLVTNGFIEDEAIKKAYQDWRAFKKQDPESD